MIYSYLRISPFLKSINTLPHNDDNIEIPKGSLAIPFHFSIPHNALESYQGKDARIVYEVEFSLDREWKKDYHHVLSFTVLNPNMTYTFGGDRHFLGEKQEKKEGEPVLGLELEVTYDVIPKFFQGQMIKGKLKN